MTGDPTRRSITGAGALRRYVIGALARAGDVRCAVERALAGTDSVVLVYTCHLPDGSLRPGADLLRVDASGMVVEWRCHYATDPLTWRPWRPGRDGRPPPRRAWSTLSAPGRSGIVMPWPAHASAPRSTRPCWSRHGD